MLSTGMITGLQCGKSLIGVRLQEALHQAPDRAHRQVQMLGDVRRRGAHLRHASDAQTK
jgi:hypothetical protein